MIMSQVNTVSCILVIYFFNVFICTCFAVTVTVDIGEVVEGSETRITCYIGYSSSSSVRNPIVTWNNIANGVTDQIAQYQGGIGFVQPSYRERFSVERDTTLVIANTSRSDSGTYQCSVQLLDDPTSPASDYVILTVIYLYKPVFSSFTTPVTEGGTVEMSCFADANPSPTYTFLRDGKVQQSWASSTFRIQSVSRDNDGSYQCRASNSAGTETSKSRMLDVQYAPEITSLSNIEVPRLDSITIRTQESVEVTVVTPTPTSVACICPTENTLTFTDEQNTTLAQKGADTGLIVGMTFVGVFIGILLSSSIFVVHGKMKNSKETVATSSNVKQPEAYMEYGEPDTENHTYQDIQKRDNDPAVYVNVKPKK
ncbi:cell surface A33 antigen-like [Anneissia japonica]|uniref:cell surface A33 antigen-like n=1 Tax=Anneissia japonica TaxID=1529436 RepID=UPI001425AE7D|nr:cell surface A33 antigen-like [Anneissia japonica]